MSSILNKSNNVRLKLLGDSNLRINPSGEETYRF